MPFYLYFWCLSICISPSDVFLFVFLMSFYLYFSLRYLSICISDIFLFVFLSLMSFYLYYSLWCLSICMSDVFLIVFLSLMSFYFYQPSLSSKIRFLRSQQKVSYWMIVSVIKEISKEVNIIFAFYLFVFFIVPRPFWEMDKCNKELQLKNALEENIVLNIFHNYLHLEKNPEIIHFFEKKPRFQRFLSQGPGLGCVCWHFIFIFVRNIFLHLEQIYFCIWRKPRFRHFCCHKATRLHSKRQIREIGDGN